MLKTRIITALIILPVVLMALFLFPTWAWTLFTLGIALTALWEWSRFCSFTTTPTRLYLFVSLIVCGAILAAHLGSRRATFEHIALVGFVVANMFWLLVVPVWLATAWRARSSWVMALVGWVVVLPMWLAMLSLRDVGSWLLLSFAVIVWVADCAAYFVGKTMGKHKLAPAISPGKTIEGALGGLIGVGLFYFLWRWFANAAHSNGEGWPHVLLASGAWLFAFFMLLTVVSILGDLFESWMKRGVGMKDSSNLLPGHGGILDRIDALTSTLPVAALYVTLMAKGHG